jgi:hypothetical protein
MERYLYISYHSDKSLKDCQTYQTLDEVKLQRGITCNEKTLALVRVGSWSSPDGSGCYLMDFQSDEGIDFADLRFSSHIMRLVPAARRHLVLDKLGINV